MIYIDAKYVEIAGLTLERFKKNRPYVWNFRCPMCGDSKRSKIKARGYLYLHKGEIVFKCHKCQDFSSFSWFLKRWNPTLFTEYVAERFKEKNNTEQQKDDEFKNFIKNSQIKLAIDMASDKRCSKKYLTNILDLDKNHPAILYIQKRKIPENRWNLLYYTDLFKELSNSFSSGKFKEPIEKEEGRIIIPFLNKNNKLFAFQGRSLGDKEPRYYSINVALNNKERIFGLERFDSTKTSYITEGPFDSLFLPNAISAAGSSFCTKTVKKMIIENDIVVIMDNQPRQENIVKLVRKNILNGYRVFIFPEELEKYKDINDMVMAGIGTDKIMNYISTNTFKGVEAELRFAEWKKVNL